MAIMIKGRPIPQREERWKNFRRIISYYYFLWGLAVVWATEKEKLIRFFERI